MGSNRHGMGTLSTLGVYRNAKCKLHVITIDSSHSLCMEIDVLIRRIDVENVLGGETESEKTCRRYVGLLVFSAC